MGRPLNKRFFGTGAGNQIKCRFKTGGTEHSGYIDAQKGSAIFICNNGAGVTARCKLVDKAQGALADGEMTITIKDDGGNIKQVLKISGHNVTVDTGERIRWTFDDLNNDSAGAIEEEGTDDYEGD